MTATLTVWSISRYGAPELLTPVTRAIPTPGSTEIQIQIRASAVTRADGMMRAAPRASPVCSSACLVPDETCQAPGYRATLSRLETRSAGLRWEMPSSVKRA